MTKKGIIYPYTAWLILFTIIPLLLIFYYSLHITVDGEAVLSLDNFRRIFEPSAALGAESTKVVYLYLDVIWQSVKLAAVCTFFCLLFGYPVGYILAGSEFNTKSTLIFLFLVPMWMNGLLRTYAWLTILENNGILNSILSFLRLPNQTMLYTNNAVVLGMVYNYIPFMILPIYTILKNTDKAIIEAAHDLGANNVNVFIRVLFPISIPGVISGVTMVFMPAVTTFVISNLLGGGHFILIGNLIEQQFLRVNDWGFGSALSSALIIIILISVAVANLVDKDSGTQGGALF